MDPRGDRHGACGHNIRFSMPPRRREKEASRVDGDSDRQRVGTIPANHLAYPSVAPEQTRKVEVLEVDAVNESCSENRRCHEGTQG